MWKTKDERWLCTPNGEVPDTRLRRWLSYHLRWVRCEYCGKTGITEPTRNGPCYHSDLPWQHRDNPNRTRMLCAECREEHDEFWDEMWLNARPSY